ncbi:hypothetical protein DXG01_000399, partial [Tephrocybe rancida]
FVKGKKTHAYQLDPGYWNLKLMGKSEVVGEVIITYIFLGKRLSLASNHMKTYFNAICCTYLNTLDMESVASFDSTNSNVILTPIQITVPTIRMLRLPDPSRLLQHWALSLLNLLLGLSAITRTHPISTIPGIGKLPEASALGLQYETPLKVKDTGGPSWMHFSQIITAPFKTN